ncbi:sacsin-like [Ostrea edulis]|uniref:sacsin-like n=1 Tax=Ostrea edulis TaxID=37623 RepID=UPI0024AF9175|nr:sacsin-like [Ostrea edulis]
MPTLAECNQAMQTFTDTGYQTSDQHVDMSRSRMEKDNNDINVLRDFLKDWDPFGLHDKTLHNIETGMIADDANAEAAKSISDKIIQSIAGQLASEISFKKKGQVVPLDIKRTSNTNVTQFSQIDPQLMFQRLTNNGSETLNTTAEMFQYELSSFPSSMFESKEDGDSDYEGLEEPPIRRQLQNILQQYPDGPQIIRELVQNAEDAEASVFKVMLCVEDHLGPGDFHPMYREIFQGPALCTFNDGVFSENDWKGIKKIYTSVKEKDALKIGRFGLGFKSVFHLTDTPIIVSGDRLLVINPTRTTEKVCHNVTFKKLTSEKYKGTLWPVLKRVFKMDAGGFFGFDTSSVEEENYPNTLFWFPLRQEPSSLLDKVCPPSKIKSLMESFRKEADTILLFLQNINTITIMENKDSILYEVTIEGVGASKQEFSKSRTFIQNQLKSLKTKPDHSLSVTYNAQLTTSNVKEGHQKTERFKIVSFFQGTMEMSQPLRKLSEEGDNVPFVGVAYPLQLDESFNAHVFCFLPLPLQSKSLTNLPIHVNGFFNLDPTRDHVLQATAGQVGKRDDKITWNELLIIEVMSRAYVKLFVDLKREGSPAEIIYRCLPEVEKVDCELWRKLLPPVYEHVFKMEVFQTKKNTWVSFENAVFDVFDKEKGEITREIRHQVIELIKDYDQNIVLLPKNLKSLVESWTMYNFLPEVHPKVISSGYVAGLLHKDPQYKLKSRESKIILLDYFLRCADPKDFRELELLPSDDKTHFLSFVSKGPLYLCSDKKTAALFPKLEKQFLSNLPKDVTTRLLRIPNNVVKEWSPENFSHLLKESIKVQGIKSASMLNIKDRKKVSLWIKKVWTFFSENQELIQEVETFPILPEKGTGQKMIQKLHVLKGDYMLSKSLNLSPLPNSVENVLEACGLILLEEVLFVQYPAVTKYIAQPTVKDVCKMMEKAFRTDERCVAKINCLSYTVRREFAQFMATNAPCDMTNSLTKFLRRVKLFPVSYSHGATQDLYAVDDVKGTAPKGLKNFPVNYCILLIDDDYRYLSFIESLGCQEYDEERLMEETLCRICSNEVYQAREVALFMKYFMDKLNDSTPNKQLEIAAAIPFIENGNKEFKPPKDFFDPLNAELCELFLGEENIQTEEDKELHFVHERIRNSIAECLGVPSLTRRVMESGGIVDLEFEQWGQEEPLTTRIRNILDDYTDGLSVYKEMLQNADDAGASCMKILYDERKNEQARTGLIDKGMEECQGPALWFYNDAKFEDKDFQNIIKLGGGTKKSEETKIGKFGLGFCSVYNVTDVPSIVSGKYLVFFDPRTIHLGKAIKDKSKPGLCIPISKVVNKFRKQFMPYNKIFQCDLSPESRGEEFDGTLFRLPLRTAKQAVDDPNGISTTEYKRGEVVSIIKKFMESAGNLLLFTQNVGRIELHYLQSDDPEKCELLYSVERKIGHGQGMKILEEAKQRIGEDIIQTLQFDIAVEVNTTVIKSLLVKDYENMTGSTSNWIVSWAVSDTELDIPGCLPVASTAIPLSFSLNGSGQVPYGFYNTGHVFCFLPLPQKSQTSVHLNGCFAVEHSRKRIVSPSPDNVSEERADWNHSLMSHALSMAYINMLENIKECAQLENCLYSTAWPVSHEGNAFNPLVDLQNDSMVGKTAFQCLQQFNPFQRQVMYMDCTIQKEFENANCENSLQAQICLEKSFHTQVFLVNLQNEFWNSEIRKEDRRNLLKRILSNKNLLGVREKMKDIECIPTKPDGLLRRPSDLINPYSKIISNMFCDSDNRFPDDEFISPDVKESLMSLGMNTDHLSDTLLLERLRSVNVCAQIDCDLAKNRFRALMRYMTHCSLSPEVLKEIQGIPFLPVMVKPKNWPCKWFSTSEFHFTAPNDLFRMDCKFLIGSVQKILDETIVIESEDVFLTKLSIKSVTDVKNNLVIGQLQAISELQNRVTTSIEESTNMERICDAVYKYLNSTPKDDLKQFQDLFCIWLATSNKLVKPCRSSLCSSDDAPPYIYKVDLKWSSYDIFLLNVGVHHHVEPELILEILKVIEMKEGGMVDNLDAVVRLYNLLSRSKYVKGFPQLLPDVGGIMRKPSDMCFEDGNEKIIDADKLVFTHADLTVKTCKKFKVQSKSAKFIRRFSTGIPFGQKEKLVTRLRNILEDYPCDISILNELVQNADDAKATEIHFVYDRQSHSTKGLFDESMKDIQGPALVVFNDTCFSEKDIEGISNLGEGSKSTDPNQTGQFGIGFNAVYHITDAPSFLTKGEQTPNGGTLIMFDPHCRYIPDATQESPGMKVDNLDCVKEKYTGTYNTYLQENLPASTGTWFRFPLRTKEMAEKSEIIKNGEIDEMIMETILMKFQQEMSNSLLFLNNVQCIKLSEINEEGKMSTRCEVNAKFLQDTELKDMKLFQSKCDRELLSLKKGEIVLGEHPGFNCNYRITLNGKVREQQWHEIWAISRVFGTMTAVAVPDLLRSGYRTKRVNLSPRAGIAACLETNFPFAEQDDNFVDSTTSSPLISIDDCHFMEQDSNSVDSHISSPLTSKTSRAFCFLPLPGPTGLPVHINGHFALNASRTHIWRDDQEEHTLKGSWNELILSDVLPFAYITSMQFHRQILFTDSECIHAESIEKYNRYFPIIDQIKDDIWKTVVEVFYNRVLSHEIALFPVLLDEETIISMRKTDFILAKVVMIQDEENSVVAFVPLKSKEQEFPAYFNEIEMTLEMNRKMSEKERFSKTNETIDASMIEIIQRKNQQEAAEITKLLKMLGLKLVDSTSEIMKSIQMSLNGEFIPKAVDIDGVMQFLRSWNTTHVDKCRIESVDVEIGTSLLIDVTKVMSLLSYCFQNGGHINQLEGIPLCVLENEKLTCFSKFCPKIVSEFCHLMKKSGDYFLHKNLVPIFEKRVQTSSCVTKFTVEQFAKLLEENISILYRSNNPVKWDNSDIEDKWIQEVWQFLSSTNKTAQECTQNLSDWCLVPVQTRSGQAYLYPLCLAYAVLSTAFKWEDRTMSYIVFGMQFPRLMTFDSFRSKNLLNYLCASESTPYNLLRMFQYHKEMYRESISTMTAATVLHFLLAKLHTTAKSKDTRTLQLFRDTCLFETLDGFVTDLPENKKIICLKDNEAIPLESLNLVYKCLDITILKRKDLLEDFVVDFMTQEDFYVDIFLKQADHLENFIIKVHMEYIRDAELYLCDRSREMKNLLSDIEWIENEETGELQSVCDFYSPYVRVCNLLCSKKDLLPSEFHSREWKSFMEFSGIKTEVPFDQLLEFGEQIERSSNVDGYVAEKSQVLVDYILQHKKMGDMGFPDFMRKFRKIKCVVPFIVLPEFTTILPQHEHCGLVCFEGSVASRGWEIMWSRCDIVPEETIKNVDSDILGIKSVPDVSDVINHIYTLCRELRTRQCSVEFSKVLMEQIYSKLNELLSTSCNSRLVSEELKRGLTETPFIYDKATDKFLHPYEVVLRLDTGKCIDSYLYRGPEEWGSFYEMFRQIGVEDQPGFYHYLRLFHSMHSKTSSNTMTPYELDIARNAFKGLVASLQFESQADLQLPQIVDLYLPSESNKLILSTELVLCNRKSLKRRIPAEFPIEYVKTDSKETIELLKKLDHQFRPKLMSQLFREEFLIGPECRDDNGMVYNPRRVFQSETFLNGILGYIQKKKSSSVNEPQRSRIKHAFQTARFKTVSTLQTVLNYNGARVDSTFEDKFICYSKSEGKMMIYLRNDPSLTSFEKCFKVWKNKLCQVVCLCTERLLSREEDELIQGLLQTESDIDILNILAKHEVKLLSKSWLPQLGSHIPLDQHDLLDNGFCDLLKEDIVAYEMFDPVSDHNSDDNIRVLDSEFIYARVMKKENDSSEEFPRYTVFDGSQDISVRSIKLYRIIRKTEEQSADLAHSSTQQIRNEGTDKDRIFADIRRMLIAAWKLPGSDRRKVIKRLLLQWHPEKNPENPNVAKDVTQFILDIIGKLERGEIGIENYSSGYSTGHVSSDHCGASSNEWYTFQETVNKCISQRQRNRRKYDYTYSRGSGYSNFGSHGYEYRPPNPQPAVALQWLRQSKYDCIAARQQLQTCIASPNSGDAVKTWNWICYKSHQSCEKTLKAMLYGEDANIASRQQTTHDLSTLSSASSSSGSVQPFVKQFSNSVTNLHTTMRYPNGGQIPGDQFTRHQAEAAVEIAARVIEECENCLG